jgi:hypothetical protein
MLAVHFVHVLEKVEVGEVARHETLFVENGEETIFRRLDEIADDFVVEVIDGFPHNALTPVQLLQQNGGALNTLKKTHQPIKIPNTCSRLITSSMKSCCSFSLQ